LLLFWRQKWILLATLALAVGGALAYIRVATPLFTSTAKVYVRPAVSVVLPGSQGGSPQAAAATFTNTQMEVIKSETVLSIAGALLDSQPELKAVGVPTKTQHLREAVDTELDRTTDIISVTAKHPSPGAAAAVTDAVVNAYIKFTTRPKEFGNTDDLLQRYQAEYKAADDELRKKQDELTALEREHGPVVRQGTGTAPRTGGWTSCSSGCR
jgi:uncharacterized protein involved in exopolysaccharide biosynthesis